ncbi:MAG: S-layer homology domain-containing protein [Candidatus Neomarinimicrobiota bacterium]
MKNFLRIASSAVLLLVLTNCSQKPQSALDTPEYHFKAGLRAVDTENLDNAKTSFQRAVDLDRKFAPAYAGLGLVCALQKNAQDAKMNVMKAAQFGADDADALALCGRVWIEMRDMDKTWFSKAEEYLTKAQRRDENHEATIYYLGLANLYQYNFRNAEGFFKQVVDGKGEYAAKADGKWALSQKVVRAVPGTMAGKKIALQEKINRADLAVLFAEELKVGELISKLPAPPAGFQTPGQMTAAEQRLQATDMQGHWAEVWVNEMVEYGVLELGANGEFFPNESISRANYAMAVQRLLVVATRDNSLETRYFGESPSRFSDVPSSHFAYNAMALCTERGIMQADVITGRFDPNGSVSGADALLIIRTLQNSLRQTF